MDQLELARIHCDGMRELIANNPAHWKDEHALDLIRALCRRAREVITDGTSRAYLSAIDDYAAALCLNAESRSLPARMLGPGALRREILRELRLLSDRLAELEAQRNLAVVGGKPARPHRRERYASVLRQAAQSVGGTPRLAKLLDVPQDDLQRWLIGAEAAPLKVFLTALNLVASGQFARDHSMRIEVVDPENPAPVAALPSTPRPVADPEEHVRRSPGAFGYFVAMTLVVSAGVLTMYLSHPAPREAAAEPPRLHTSAARAEMTETVKVAPKAPDVRKRATAPRAKVAAAPVLVAAAEPIVADPCASLSGAASLQCQRCSSSSGLSWLFCQESARLEYCQGRDGLEAACPSVIPGASRH
jgi:hypothetical protein